MVDTSPPTYFEVDPEGYDRLMGRYLLTLGKAIADAADLEPGRQVLDVGCGTGGVTTVLVHRVGAAAVTAIDPSVSFVDACRFRNPGVDVRVGQAERLPFVDDTFDVTIASLVVGFLADPATGVAEMCRVTRPGGQVALVFWTHDRMPLLNTFWTAAAAAGAPVAGDAERPGRRSGELSALLTAAGAYDVGQQLLVATAHYTDLDDWWSSFTGGAGPVGAHYQQLDEDRRAGLRERCADLLGRPDGTFIQEAWAWCAIGTIPSYPGPSHPT